MCIFIKYLETISWAHTRKSLSGFKSELTSSRAGGCGLARLAAAGREVGAGADGLAVASFFLSFLGLSRESSTVASARGEMCRKISIISLVQWSCFYHSYQSLPLSIYRDSEFCSMCGDLEHKLELLLSCLNGTSVLVS